MAAFVRSARPGKISSRRGSERLVGVAETSRANSSPSYTTHSSKGRTNAMGQPVCIVLTLLGYCSVLKACNACARGHKYNFKTERQYCSVASIVASQGTFCDLHSLQLSVLNCCSLFLLMFGPTTFQPSQRQSLIRLQELPPYQRAIEKCSHYRLFHVLYQK